MDTDAKKKFMPAFSNICATRVPLWMRQQAKSHCACAQWPETIMRND
jgi:hypothetical protein